MAFSRASGARFDQLLQQTSEPAFWLTAELKLAWVNRAWEALTGHTAGSVAGLVCRAHGPSRDGDLPGLGGSFYPPPEVLAGRAAGARTLIVHPSGERRWRRVEYWPFHDEKNALFAILGLVRALEDAPLASDSEGDRLRLELMEVRDRLFDRFGLDNLIGRGPSHRRLLDQVAAAAASKVPVLLIGEPGTGKRTVARTVHQLGTGNQAPFFPLDCAAMPPDVMERTLFGPAGSNGEASGVPRFVLPGGSTLLIGDVVGLARDLQARLASALGGETRLIAATSSEPDAALAADRLRPDLYYALTTLVIRLSPLRERLDELPLLAQHFLERANRRGGRQRGGFSDEAMKTLTGYDWPGNLRELARVVDDAHGRGDGDSVDADDLPAAIRGHLGGAYTPAVAVNPVTPLDELLTQVERRLIESALQRAKHNKSRAAELLGISRPRLYRRIKELNLPDEPEPAEVAPVVHDGLA